MTETEPYAWWPDLGSVVRALRQSGLDAEGRRAWDAVLADVHRAYPLARLGDWLSRLTGRG